MDPMVNVAADGVCMLFTLLILVYLRMSPDRHEQLNRLFTWLCVFNMGMLLGDIPDWLFEGYARPWYPAALHVGIFVLYVSGCFITWVYSLYIYSYLSQKTKVKKQFKTIMHALFAVNAFLLFINYFNKMYYFIDGNNVYQRGPWHWLSQAMPVIILLFDLAVILYHRRDLRLKEIAAFFSYLMMPVIGITVQAYIYGISTTYLASSASIFMIFLCIQSEQRLLAQQQKRDLEKAQLQIMLSQMQPHFLYNSLQGIKLLCDTHPTKASEALEHFSFYLRGNLDSLVDVRLIPFEKELSHVNDYLFLEKIRWRDQLDLVWKLEVTDFVLPPLTVQPMVENAVRHGLGKKRIGGTVTVSSERMQDSVVITICDDGIGFDPMVKKEDGRAHIGIENTRNRLERLCGGMLLIESEKNVGTVVKIILPQQISLLEG